DRKYRSVIGAAAERSPFLFSIKPPQRSAEGDPAPGNSLSVFFGACRSGSKTIRFGTGLSAASPRSQKPRLRAFRSYPMALALIENDRGSLTFAAVCRK